MAPVSDTVSLVRLWRLFRELRPDIVHSHSPKAALLGTLAARIAGVPMVVVSIFGLRQMTKTGPNLRLLNATTKLECRLADRVWCDSPSMRRYVITQGLCQPAKVVVLGNGSVNGVDSTRTFSPECQTGQRDRIRELMEIPSHHLVIGFVGRITADKGMHELAQAWRQLRQERSDVHLLLVGPFEPLDPLDSVDFALFHEDSRVHVTGMQKEVAPYFTAMDIFAMPSYREGFSITNIEAASLCLPVVATSIPGCVDSVQDGVTGTLVPVKDSLRLLAALREYCDDAALRQKHGQAGRSRVIAEFGPERIWQELESLYTTSSSRRRGGRS
jgi:glycosyltransferase involved in cell wall biosynthesis